MSEFTHFVLLCPIPNPLGHFCSDLFVLKKKKTMSYSSGPGQWDPKHEQDGRKSRSGQMEMGMEKNYVLLVF